MAQIKRGGELYLKVGHRCGGQQTMQWGGAKEHWVEDVAINIACELLSVSAYIYIPKEKKMNAYKLYARIRM